MFKSFRRWLTFNLFYFGRPPWDTGITPPELMQFIETHAPGKALDLGCGTGTNLLTLAHAGWQVTGVDFAWLAVFMAWQRLRRAGLRAVILQGDVTRLHNLQDSFNLILDIGCFHGLSDSGKQAYQRNLQRLLAGNGTFLIYAHHKEEDDPGTGIRETDIQRLAEEFELIQREDSTDRFGHAACWLTFRRN